MGEIGFYNHKRVPEQGVEMRYMSSKSMALLFVALLFFVGDACRATDGSAPERETRGFNLPGSMNELKALLGTTYTYLDRGDVLFSSDLEQKTFVRLTTQDFLLYSHILTRNYFTKTQKAGAKDPEIVMFVFLFKDRDSYIKGLRKMGLDIPVKDEGNFNAVRNGYFYKRGKRSAIIVNCHDDYAQGLSIYAHEITHSLIVKEFPDVPVWFNEGFATMVGHSRIVNSHLQFIPSGTRERLLLSLTKGDAIPLAKLLQSVNADFGNEKSGVYYEAAEQFCLFLHSRNQLMPVYRDLRDGGKKGADSASVVTRITGRPIPDLEKDWLAWVKNQK